MILCLPIAFAVSVVVSSVAVSDEFINKKGITAAVRVIIVIINVKILLPILNTFFFLSKK